MELLLIRHCLPVRVEGVDGAADPPLAELGRRQAHALAEWLSAETLHAIYTSPMRRAVETAAPLAAATGLGPIVDEDLAEFDRHATAYVPIEEARAEGGERWEQMLAGVDAYRGVIDTDAWFDAVVTGVERVVAAHPGQAVAVVAHGGVVNAYLAHVLGLGRQMFFEPSYASISRVVAARSGRRQLLSVNEAAHTRSLRVA